MPAAVIYARISKDDAGDRLGVDRQERLCRDLAKRHGLTINDVLVDNDVSAYKGRCRPAFERLVELLDAGAIDAVVAYHADRLYRRATDLERLVAIIEQSSAKVHTVAAGDVDLSTASGRMVARMLGAAAQHESERMGERLRAKHDELAAKGNFPGGRPPYGYSRGYVVDEVEASAVRRMAKRVLEGASLLSIARELTAAGIPTREGRAWHHSSVRATLVNPAVAGLRVHRREVAGPGNWESVLDRDTWERVRAVLADPARKRTRPARQYLLAGLVRSTAGDPMNGRPEKSGPAYTTRYQAEVPTSIDAERLEAHVVESVLIALRDWKPSEAPTDDLTAAAIAEIDGELTELAKLRGERRISMSEWLAARVPLEEALAEARAKAGRVRPQTPLRGRNVRQTWEAADFDQRRQAIAAVVEEVVIDRATRGRWTTTAERVTIRWRA